MYQIDKIQYLQIGVQGENVAQTIEIDMSTWAEEFPDATFHVIFKPYNATAPSPMLTTYVEPVLSWTVTLGATAVAGVGYTEVRAQDAETGLVKKSRIIPTAVETSVSGVETDPPASYQEWVDAVLNSAAAVLAAAHGKQVKFEIKTETGHLMLCYSNDEVVTVDTEWTEVDLGPVDAYAIAVLKGYEGTADEFAQYMANIASGASAAAASATAAAASAAEAAQYTSDAVATWLNNKFGQISADPPLDRTLSQALAAAPADMVGDLKSAFVESVGDFQYVENTSGTGNLYCDRAISLTGGEVIQIKICNWSLALANRTSITVYARGSSNVSMGTIATNIAIPSDVYEFTVPSGSFTSIRVAFKANVAAGSASVLIGIKKNTYITTVEKKAANDLLAYAGEVNTHLGEGGYLITASNTTKYIYCDRELNFSGGDRFLIDLVSCSSSLFYRYAVYIFNGDESTKIVDYYPKFLPPPFIVEIPSGTYDKIRVMYELTQADGTTTCKAIISKINSGSLTESVARLMTKEKDYSHLKINCLGDSLTYGYVPSGSGTSPMNPTWVTQLGIDLGCTVRNYGITNNSVSNNTGGSGDPMCIRYTTMDNDADIVIVMGGTNDFLRVNAPLGTIDSMVNTTFYGAYNVLVQGLLSKYMARKTRIILMVPPMRNRSTEHNTQGTTLQQIQQAVRDIANKYALPYVDWAYDAGISAYLIGTDTGYVYTYDGIHIKQEIVLGWILPMIEAKVIETIQAH